MKVKVTFSSPIVESDPPELELGTYSQGVAIEPSDELSAGRGKSIMRCVATRKVLARQTSIGDWKLESSERPHRIYSQFFIQGVSLAQELRDVPVTEGEVRTMKRSFDG